VSVLFLFLVSGLICWIDSAIGRKVTGYIIPAVAHLRQLYPINLKMILPMESLGLKHITDTINCQDIQSCDELFDSFQYKSVNFLPGPLVGVAELCLVIL
jgi:hypothetical protein